MAPLAEKQPSLQIPDDRVLEVIVASYIAGLDVGGELEAERNHAGNLFRDRESQHLRVDIYASLAEGKFKFSHELRDEFKSTKRALMIAGQILRKAQTEILSPVDIEELRKIKVFLKCSGYTETMLRCDFGVQMVAQFKDIISRYEKGEPQIIYPAVLSPKDQAAKNAEELAAFTQQARATMAAQENMRYAEMYREQLDDSEIFTSPTISYTSLDGSIQLTAQQLLFKFGELFNEDEIRVVAKVILFKARQEHRGFTLEEVEQLRMIMAFHKAVGFTDIAMDFLFERHEITEMRKAIKDAEAAYAPKTK